MLNEYRGQYTQGTTIRLIPGDYFKIYETNDIEKMRIDTFLTKEPETIAFVRSFTNDCIFFDIGANIGIYSLLAQSLCPAARVCIFEPQRTNLDRLLENAALNSFRRFEPKAVCAVGATDDNWIWFIPGSRLPGAADGHLDTENHQNGHAYLVPMYTVDSLARIYGTPNYIKIDVDGGEVGVVAGMVDTLLNPALKSVLIEIPTATGADDIVSNYGRNLIYHTFIEAGFTDNNTFNTMTPHSRDRRREEGIAVDNVVFTRV